MGVCAEAEPIRHTADQALIADNGDALFPQFRFQDPVALPNFDHASKVGGDIEVYVLAMVFIANIDLIIVDNNPPAHCSVRARLAGQVGKAETEYGLPAWQMLGQDPAPDFPHEKVNKGLSDLISVYTETTSFPYSPVPTAQAASQPVPLRRAGYGRVC